MTITDDIQDAILKIPAAAWTPAYDAEGQARDGAWVAEITGMLDERQRRRGQPARPARPAAALPWRQVPVADRTREKGHGRAERRTLTVTAVAAGLAFRTPPRPSRSSAAGAR
jgi:hypothetical protein